MHPRDLLSCGSRMIAVYVDWLPIEFRVVIRELLDENELILGHIGKMLPRVRRRPPDIEAGNARSMPKPDMLLHRASAE
jgi:hypothetical protein